MKIYPDQLAGQLQQVAPAYLIHGDDGLLSEESAHTIRNRVLQAGNVERLLYQFDNDFKWDEIYSQLHELSLFSPLKLIEIHLRKGLDKSAHQHLLEVVDHLSSDICLLLVTPSLKKAQQQQAWVKKIDQLGLIISANTPQDGQLKRWILKRLQFHQLQPASALAELLFHYYEGNLLALNQVIEQLKLTYPNHQVDIDAVEHTFIESGQFTQYQLVDTLLAGNLARAQQIAQQITQQGEELTLFNWLLDRDLNVVAQLQSGQAPAPLWKKYSIWNKRQPLIRQCAERLSRQQVRQARSQLAVLDQSIKNVDDSSSYEQFNQLLLIFLSPTWGSPC